MQKYLSQSPEETQSLGKEYSKNLKPGSVTALFGELGTGKTQFIKGVCSGLGVESNVNSPTFIIVNEYDSNIKCKIFHFDLFRIKSPDEVMDIGFYDYLNSEGIILIEWPELIENLLPDCTSKIYISHIDGEESKREIRINIK